jgi:hypothetical protein
MWVVGILRHGEFHPLEDSPGFSNAIDAKAWASDFLRKNPGALMLGVDCMTWRLLNEQAVH